MDYLTHERRRHAEEFLSWVADHVFGFIFLYIVAAWLASSIIHLDINLGGFPYKMRVCAVAICVMLICARDSRRVSRWVCQVSVAALSIEAIYLASFISPTALMQGDIGSWIVVEYIGCITLPMCVVSAVQQYPQDDS